MRQTSLLNVALCAIALTASLPASAEIVNGETDARAFAVREGELRREQAAEDAAEQAQAQAASSEPAKPETKAEKRRAKAEEKAAKVAAAKAEKLEKSKADKSAKADKADKTGKAEKAEEQAAEAPQPEPQKPSGFLALFQPPEKAAPGLAEINTKPEDEAPAASAASAPGPAGLRAIVARHAAANGVPFSLADAVVKVESRYNPRAANRGNYGLMQIRHQTARGVGYDGSASGLLDAETNARYGMKYLAQAYKLANGDTCGTIMRYQNGHMSTRMTGANRTYCAKVRTITASN